MPLCCYSQNKTIPYKEYEKLKDSVTSLRNYINLFEDTLAVRDSLLKGNKSLRSSVLYASTKLWGQKVDRTLAQGCIDKYMSEMPTGIKWMFDAPPDITYSLTYKTPGFYDWVKNDLGMDRQQFILKLRLGLITPEYARYYGLDPIKDTGRITVFFWAYALDGQTELNNYGTTTKADAYDLGGLYP